MYKHYKLILLLIMAAIFLSCRSHEKKRQMTLQKQTDVESIEGKKQLTIQKQNDVKSLASNMLNKLTTLNYAHQGLDNKATTYSMALRDWKFAGIDRAMQDSRGKGNLLALQKALAYKNIVLDEYTRTYDAYQELLGVSEQLELDMIMLNSFDEANFDELLKKLEDVLVNVQPMAQELVIGEKNMRLPDLDSVWKDYVAK